VIRYFALAFIFFQVATTAALATQLVLFAEARQGDPPAPAGPVQVISRTEDGNAARNPTVSIRYVEVPASSAPSP
jgi:hypothetical protein